MEPWGHIIFLKHYEKNFTFSMALHGNIHGSTGTGDRCKWYMWW